MQKRLARALALAALAAAGAALAGENGPAVRLSAPTVIEDKGKPIDVEVGHAAPFVIDWDGDGKQDLLVGQFGQGKARVYRNRGTAADPRFDGFEFLSAGGADARVPSG